MVPSIVFWGSALTYLVLMGVIGGVTGVVISLVLRRRPSGRDAAINFLVAVTSAVVIAIFLAVGDDILGATVSEPLSLVPIAVGSVVLWQLVAIRRHRS